MRNMVMAMAAGLALAACGSERSGTIETEDGAVDYTIDQSGDSTTASFTGADGQRVDIQGGSDAQIDWPAGYSLYPGAEVVSTMTVQQEDGSGLMVSFQSDDAVDAVIAHYRRQAEAAGTEIGMELKSGDMQTVGGEGFGLTASPSGNGGTTAQLTLSRGL